MREVLISIKPRWCELIASGEKTVEVRKTKPKLETPFKCYIYCTKGETVYLPRDIFGSNALNGKVIGEFVCDRIIGTCPWRLKGETGWCAKRAEEEKNLPNNACLTLEEIEKYAGSSGRGIYGWHITDLVVYDEPRELGEFLRATNVFSTLIHDIAEEGNGPRYNKFYYPLKRPPQSFCYIEPRQTAD